MPEQLVTHTFAWAQIDPPRQVEVTVQVPSWWTRPETVRNHVGGPLAMAECFYEMYGAAWVTPQECCDFMNDLHHHGVMRLKQLVAWRRAQVRLHGTFDWTDHSSAFAVAP